MSSTQAPVCLHHHDPLHNESVLNKAIFHHSTLPEEENTMGRKRAESVAQYKLPTYQAAAVVSTVLAGIESQLLVFFKTSPDFIQLKEPVTLQYLLVLSYIALIFSVSATISSLVLTRNIPRLAGRLRAKIRGTAKCGFDVPPFQTELSDASGIIPRRWRWIEWHWSFTLVVSMLCLPAQIFFCIWMHEGYAIRAAVSVAGLFAMLPLLHFLPIPSRSTRDHRKPTGPTFPRYSGRVNRPRDDLLPAPMSLPPLICPAHPASPNIALPYHRHHGLSLF